MSLEVKTIEIPGVLFLRTRVFSDARGQFSESYNAANFEPWLGPHVFFVQDNQTYSKQGVLRGLHYQTERTQGKLLRVLRGTIFDVVVDLRRSSSTFGRWHGVELSAPDPMAALDSARTGARLPGDVEGYGGLVQGNRLLAPEVGADSSME